MDPQLRKKAARRQLATARAYSTVLLYIVASRGGDSNHDNHGGPNDAFEKKSFVQGEKAAVAT